MYRFSRALALGLALLLLTGPGRADPPPEMDPVSIYAVTPQAGAWMILAASYRGNDGKELCRQLILELRNKHRLPAYVFNLAERVRRQQLEEEEKRFHEAHPGVPFHPHTYHIEDEWAVLIGGYRDLAAANAALPAIRNLPAPVLRLPGHQEPFCEYLEELHSDGKKIQTHSTPLSPFHKAMCVPNPTLPRSQQATKYDPFWEKLNAEEPYSLMHHCKHRWTFAVKEYKGASVVQAKATSGGIMDSLSWLGGKNAGQMLDAAALQARNLAENLHKFGFEVYIMHTRTSSIVTIGSFDNPTDLQAQHVRQQYETFQQHLLSACAQAGRPDPLQLLSQPAPMEVPHP